MRQLSRLGLASCLLVFACTESDDPLSITNANMPATAACPAPVTLGAPGDCDPSIGLTGPLPVCSTADPCSNGGKSLTVAINPVTSRSCGGDPVQTWTDANGDLRYACVFRPADGLTHPLLVFFPGSLSNTSAMYDATGLRSLAATLDLSNGSDGPGFALAAVQERNLHHNADGDGQHWDNDFRDLSATSCNPDVRSVDTLIDAIAADGSIDPDRIYVAGWSNGGFFAQMYGIARHVTPTPGGHQVAATIAYTAADPFGPIVGSAGSCQLSSYPTTDLPIYAIHRSCDLVGCNAGQDFGGTGYDVERWLAALVLRDRDRSGQDVIIDAIGKQVTTCMPTPPCTSVLATANHVRWPDGTLGDQTNWEPAMMDFLRANPLHP